jgi:hypothetical protein
MSKLTVNETKHIDKLQEALEGIKKRQNTTFKNVGEYGKYIKSLREPTYEQKAIIMYSILDMIESRKDEWGEMNEQKIASIVASIAGEVGIPAQELLKCLMHLLSDPSYFTKIAKAYRNLFLPDDVS